MLLDSTSPGEGKRKALINGRFVCAVKKLNLPIGHLLLTKPSFMVHLAILSPLVCYRIMRGCLDLCSSELYRGEEKTFLRLTADERVISSRSPPALERSDGNMLLRTVAALSLRKMASCLIPLDIYLNKVLRSVFDEGHVCKHPTHYDSNIQTRSVPRSDRIC